MDTFIRLHSVLLFTDVMCWSSRKRIGRNALTRDSVSTSLSRNLGEAVSTWCESVKGTCFGKSIRQRSFGMIPSKRCKLLSMSNRR